ncbi:MAG: hypothetical protein Q8O00_01015 [Holophaga sp.]|nr:hypothetical protein [Holophaga sp.]
MVLEIDAEDAVLRSLEATGMRHWEALGQVSVLVGHHVARQEWRMALERRITTTDAVATLDELAEFAPDLAQELLQDWLRGHRVEGDLLLNGLTWVRSLPEGLSVEGNLGLVGCVSLESIGSETVVAGSLSLLGCHGLSQLGTGLSVGRELDIRACRHLSKLSKDLEVGGDLRLWAGVEIPIGIRVGGRVIFG